MHDSVVSSFCNTLSQLEFSLTSLKLSLNPRGMFFMDYGIEMFFFSP